MNTLTTIAICLLGSAVLQGLGFYLYSRFYKKRNLANDFGAQVSSLAENRHSIQQPATRQQTGHKQNSTVHPFAFDIQERTDSSGQPVPPVIPLHTKGAKRSAK